MSAPIIEMQLTPEQCAVAEQQWKQHGQTGSGIFGDLRVASGVLYFRIYTPDEVKAIQAVLTKIDKRRKGKAVEVPRG